MKKNIIIDTDPGIDDAVALTLAFKNTDKLDIKLLTTVCGNVDVNKTTLNTLKLVEFFNMDIPVAKGASEPLIKKLETAGDVHGESGMDGYEFPQPKIKIINDNAVDAMRKSIMESREKVTVIPIAALTNIALLLKTYPEVKNNIEEIILMGGSLSRGNTNTIAEFNIYVDPHAAKIVFNSGVKLTMVGLDVTSTAILKQEHTEEIKSYGKTGEMFYSLFRHYRGGSLKTGLKMHDACAIAYLLNPSLFKTQETYIDIQTDGAASGATVGDLKMKYHGKTNCTVCLELNLEKFQHWILNELKK